MLKPPLFRHFVERGCRCSAFETEKSKTLREVKLYTDGAAVLYDYSRRHPDDPIKLLTVVASGQRVFHEVILDYLTRITFDHDPWATELIVPVTQHPLLRVRPGVAAGEPLFIVGGAPLSVVRSRYVAGEPVESIAADYDVPREHIIEALGAVWPSAA